MAHIVTVSRGFPSTLYPSLELSRRLAADGHRLTFAGGPEARPAAEVNGLEFLPLPEGRFEEFLQEDLERSWLGRLLKRRMRRQEAVESLGLEAFAESLRSLEPDLVLIDGEMHEHVITAAGAGLPVALLNSFASIWRRPGLPPAHRFVQPGVGWKGSRPGMALLWAALRWRKRLKAARLWLRDAGCDRRSRLEVLAREAGFDLQRETDPGQWLIPFTYRNLPVLSLHALDFEFPHEPPPHVRYVGPMVLKERGETPLPEEDRRRLEGVLERRREKGREHRLIYAGFGSELTSDLSFLRRLLEAVAGRSRWDLLLSLSGRIPLEELGELPDGVHAFHWLPQWKVVRHADVVVTHGGINTLDECVLAGVPVLVYNGGETDMAGNAARVVHHGFGLAGDRRRDGAAAIRAHLESLAEGRPFRTAARRLQSLYQAYEDESVAERTVEGLLRDASKKRAASRETS